MQQRFLMVLFLITSLASAQEPDSQNDEPDTRTAPTIRTHIYDRMIEAQICLEEEGPECALAVLEELAAVRDLNDYERANMLNFYAAAYFDLEDFDAAAGAYEDILDLPRAELPDGFVQAAMRNLSNAYWNLGRLQDSVRLLDEWMALPTTEPSSRDWYQKGSLHYQLEEYRKGAAAIEQAVGLARNRGEIGEEAWYQLLAALYSELDETELVIANLTILVEHWTERDHVLQLAGQLSSVGRETDTLALYEVAYEMGWLTSSRDLVTLATLQLQAETPYKAAQVLQQGLDHAAVESTERNWNLLAEAWALAREHDRAIPAFEHASKLAEDGNIDARLAQSFAFLALWDECIETSRRGIERGGLNDPGLTWMQLGQCLVNLREWDQAEAAFREAEKIESSRQSALQWLAYVNSRRETDEDNARKLQEALEIAAGITEP